ncbi:MAG: hypothetical protein ACKO4Q_03005, partial [Planctomycetota bacterium]
ELSISGEIARKDASHVRLAVLVGALRKGCDTPLNFVNAPRLAAERGLAVHERADEESHFLHSLVKARAISRTGEVHVVGGSVFGRDPRIVRIDDHYLDLAPQGPLLITTHVDQPGVVGLLGTALGAAHINIRRIELGPGTRAADGLARGFLALDEQPSQDVLDTLARLEPIRSVRVVQL